MKVMHLDDQGAEPIDAALRVSLAAREVRHLSGHDRNMLAISRSHPAAPLEAEEKLPEACDVRADFTAGPNVNDMDMRLSGSGSQLGSANIPTLKVDHGRKFARRRTEEYHANSHMR